jgi:ubiquinone/menaquinone biosynthesis C-methylase UbiE
MPHKFDPQNFKKLDTDRRRAIMPPTETLIRLGLKDSDIMADIGCGAGYFTIPAAQMLSSANPGSLVHVVYALDTSDTMLSQIKAKALGLAVSNIRCQLTDEYDFKLPNACASFVLIANVLHEVEDKPGFLLEAKRLLKPGGVLAVIEWQKRPMDMGPKLEERIDSNELEDLLLKTGLTPIQAFDFPEDFYAVTARGGIDHD